MNYCLPIIAFTLMFLMVPGLGGNGVALAEEQWQGPGYHQADPEQSHQPRHQDDRQDERSDYRDDQQLKRDYKWTGPADNNADNRAESGGAER